MSVDLAQALQDFSATVDFIRKTNQQIYDVYVNPTPKAVTIYGPDGQVISSVPNRAKLVAEFEEWKNSARIEFNSANICPNPYLIDSDGSGVPDGLAFVNTKILSTTVLTPKKDGTPDEQIAYKLIAFALRGNPEEEFSGNNLTIFSRFRVLKLEAELTTTPGQDAILIFFPANAFIGRGQNKQVITNGCFYYLPEDYTGKLAYRWDSPYGAKLISPNDNETWKPGFHVWLDVQTLNDSSYYGFIFAARNALGSSFNATVYIAAPFTIPGFSYGFGVTLR